MSLQDSYNAFEEYVKAGVFVEHSGAPDGGITVHSVKEYLKCDEFAAESDFQDQLDVHSVKMNVSLEDTLNHRDLDKLEKEYHFNVCSDLFAKFFELLNGSTAGQAKDAREAALKAYDHLDEQYDYIDYLEDENNEVSNSIAFMILRHII